MRIVIGPSAASAASNAARPMRGRSRPGDGRAPAAAAAYLGRQLLQAVEPARGSATLAPAPASTCAKWRPKPEDAPVTSAVLPASENAR